MSTPTQPAVVIQTPGCWDNFTTAVSNSTQWIGRQVSFVGGKMKEWAVVAYRALAAFFARVCAAASHYGAIAIQFAKENKGAVGAGAIGLALAVIGGIAYNRSSSEKVEAEVKAEVKKKKD